jgi:hypothetical protein
MITYIHSFVDDGTIHSSLNEYNNHSYRVYKASLALAFPFLGGVDFQFHFISLFTVDYITATANKTKTSRLTLLAEAEPANVAVAPIVVLLPI